MKRQTIAIDIDEVLSPLHDLVFAHHNEVYGTNYPLRDPIDGYYLADYTGEPHEVIMSKLKKFIETEAFQNVQPLEGAIEILNELKNRFELVIITARQDFYNEFTQEWLAKHFPKTFRDVHSTEFVIDVGMKVPKSVICKQVGASYLIDDNLDTALECVRAGLKVILFGDYPWNQTGVLPKGITRCRDWQAVKEYFDAQN